MHSSISKSRRDAPLDTDVALMFSFLKKSLSSTTDSDNKDVPVEEVETVLEAVHEQELFRWKETVYDIIRVSEQRGPGRDWYNMPPLPGG